MTSYLYANKIRIFDYPQFAAPHREEIRNNADQLASDNGIKIQFVRKKMFEKKKSSTT
jgi:hypothetical protein